jgi:hypothetical protein
MEGFVKVLLHDQTPEVGGPDDLAALSLAQAAVQAYSEARSVKLRNDQKLSEGNQSGMSGHVLAERSTER